MIDSHRYIGQDGRIRVRDYCRACQGTGKAIGRACKECRGTGAVWRIEERTEGGRKA